MTSIVVLTNGGQFHAEVDIKKFWSWIAKDKIHVLASHDGEKTYVNYDRKKISVDQAVKTFKVRRPMIVQLLKFKGYHPKTEEINWSKEAVFQRDENICQYWHYDEMGRKFQYRCKPGERTCDHVIPKIQGGGNTFDNTVCSCRNCNTVIKKGRTPKEAGLKLIRKPFIPKRNKNSFVYYKFPYDKNKLSHRIYMKIMKGEEVS
jgi:5-methylcytosine-specific restriction endonuclease McrA